MQFRYIPVTNKFLAVCSICFIIIDFQLYFRISYYIGWRKSGESDIELDTALVCAAHDINQLY